MSLGSLKKIWILAILLFVVALVSLSIIERRIESSIQGNLLFAGADGVVAPFSKIEIDNVDGKITVYNDGNLWRVVEAENYYVSSQLLTSILNNISTAKIGTEYTVAEPDTKEWTTIKLFGKDDSKGISAQLSDADKTGVHFVRVANKEGTYHSTWKTQVPFDVLSWTRQPLLDLNGRDVSALVVDDAKISRREEGASFYNGQTGYTKTPFEYVRIFNMLNDLRYEEVLPSEKFDFEKYENVRTIEYTTFEGLICRLQVYTDYHEYWLSINLSTTTLPSNSVRDYIEHNSVYFKDWLFRLPVNEGRILFMFKL